MSEQRVENVELLPSKPLLFGAGSAFDMFGARGKALNRRIQKRWRLVMDQPRKSSADRIRDRYFAFANKYRNLLLEHEE